MKVITFADSPAEKTSLKLLKYGLALHAKRKHIRIETQISVANQKTMPMSPSKPRIPAATPINIVVSNLASVNAFKLRCMIMGF